MLPEWTIWFLKAIMVTIFAFITARIIGKRALAEMSPFDLLMVSIVGEMFAHALAETDHTTPILVSNAFVLLGYICISLLLLRNGIRRFIKIHPTVLVNKGKIHEKGLRQVRMTVEELLGHLRASGHLSVADVEFAMLEENGQLSIVPKPPSGVPVQIPVPIILEGEWLYQNLSYSGRTPVWVKERLKLNGYTEKDIPGLMLVQIEPDGSLSISPRRSDGEIKFPPETL